MVEQHCFGDTGSNPVSGPNLIINFIINQNFTIMFEKGQTLSFEDKFVVVLATIKTDAVICYLVANHQEIFVLMEKHLQAKLSTNRDFNIVEVSTKDKIEYEMFSLNIDGDFIDAELNKGSVITLD